MVVLKKEIFKNSIIQFELEQLKKRVRMLNFGTPSLDHVLYMGRTSKGHEDPGYKKGSSRTKVVVWTDAQAKLSSFKNAVWTNPIPTNPGTGPSSLNKRRPKGIRCYYCRKMGHVLHQCIHYRADQKKRLKENQPVVKQKWVEKGKAKSFVVFTSLKPKAKQRRYFDSGISQHMIGNNSSFS